jgi:hypothetical protein
MPTPSIQPRGQTYPFGTRIIDTQREPSAAVEFLRDIYTAAKGPSDKEAPFALTEALEIDVGLAPGEHTIEICAEWLDAKRLGTTLVNVDIAVGTRCVTRNLKLEKGRWTGEIIFTGPGILLPNLISDRSNVLTRFLAAAVQLRLVRISLGSEHPLVFRQEGSTQEIKVSSSLHHQIPDGKFARLCLGAAVFWRGIHKPRYAGPTPATSLPSEHADSFRILKQAVASVIDQDPNNFMRFDGSIAASRPLAVESLEATLLFSNESAPWRHTFQVCPRVDAGALDIAFVPRVGGEAAFTFPNGTAIDLQGHATWRSGNTHIDIVLPFKKLQTEHGRVPQIQFFTSAGGLDVHKLAGRAAIQGDSNWRTSGEARGLFNLSTHFDVLEAAFSPHTTSTWFGALESTHPISIVPIDRRRKALELNLTVRRTNEEPYQVSGAGGCIGIMALIGRQDALIIENPGGFLRLSDTQVSLTSRDVNISGLLKQPIVRGLVELDYRTQFQASYEGRITYDAGGLSLESIHANEATTTDRRPVSLVITGASALPIEENLDYKFLAAPMRPRYEDGHLSDILRIRKNNTSSGFVEITAFSASSRFQDKLFESTTPIPQATNLQFAVGYGAGASAQGHDDKCLRPNLYVFRPCDRKDRGNRGWGQIAVCSGASDFTTLSFGPGSVPIYEDTAEFLMAPLQNRIGSDAHFIERVPDAAGRRRVTALDSSSDFKRASRTMLTQISVDREGQQVQFVMAPELGSRHEHRSYDPAIVEVIQTGTASRSTEIRVLDREGQASQANITTALEETDGRFDFFAMPRYNQVATVAAVKKSLTGSKKAELRVISLGEEMRTVVHDLTPETPVPPYQEASPRQFICPGPRANETPTLEVSPPPPRRLENSRSVVLPNMGITLRGKLPLRGVDFNVRPL